jgi:3',5'-cyclic AMP phosphodiesterase CpdA
MKTEVLEGEAPESSGGFTFVHITDQHVQKRRAGDKGYHACIESVNAIWPRPHFAVMGGDMPFDGNYNPKEKFIEDIKLYRDISNELDMPYFHCMGNHDVLGWHPRRKVPVDDPDLGKKCIMDILEWPSSYYSFDYRGWHFVVLDCIKGIDDPERGPTHIIEIDEEQMEWLGADLGKNHGKPIVAFTHVAAFCNIGQIRGNKEAKAMNMVINNNRDLRHLLERHDVKALVQGHSHDIQEFYYNGVWYVTTAAASAAWWGGNWLGFEPGYTVFKCNGEDLSWEHKTFEWKHRLEPEDTLEKKKIKERDEFLEQQENLMKREIFKGKTLKPSLLPKLHVRL